MVLFYYLIWRGGAPAKQLARMALAFSATVGFGLIVAKVLAPIVPWLIRHAFSILVLPFSVIIIWVLIEGIKALVDIHRDRRHLNDVSDSTALTRDAIATDFLGFRTEWYRRRYVEWLRDAQVNPTGAWADFRPNKGDAASTLLSQLDERWLQLEG